MKQFLLFFAFLIVLASAVCAPAAACVDADGDGFNSTGGVCGVVDCDDTNASILPAYEDMSITGDTWLCPGTYYLNDSNINGVIAFGANNVNLYCQGAILYGNWITNSIGIYDNNFDNILIKDCNLVNYTYANYIRASDNVVINNNTMNYSKYGVRMRIAASTTVINSSFYARDFGAYTFDYAVRVHYDSNGHNTITNNIIDGYHYGVYLEEINEYCNVTDNTISNTDLTGILTFANHTYIDNNTIYNVSHNGISFRDCNDTTVSNNYIENFKHHGIDNHNDNYIVASNNNVVVNNTILQSDSTFYSVGTAAIFMQSTKNTRVYLNNITNIYNASTLITTGRGIVVEGGGNASNNIIYNNSLYNVTGNCIKSGANNTLFANNTLSLCDNEYMIYGYRTVSWDTSQYLDNIHNTPTYKINNEMVGFTVNETSTSWHYINLSNNGAVNFTGNFRKQFTITNNTVNITNLASPYDDIYNATGSTVIAYDQTSYDITVPANQVVLVGNFAPMINWTVWLESGVTMTPPLSGSTYLVSEAFGCDFLSVGNYCVNITGGIHDGDYCYIGQTIVFTNSTNVTNATYGIVNIHIYNEENISEHITSRMYLELLGHDGNNYSTHITTTGMLNYTMLIGEFEIRYYGTDYGLRAYYDTLLAGQVKTISLYALNSSDELNIYVQDFGLAGVANATVTIQRWYTEIGGGITVAQMKTNELGHARFYVNKDYAFYKILVSYAGNTVFESDWELLTESTYRITTDFQTLYTQWAELDGALTLVEQPPTYYFKLVYNNKDSLIDEVCLKTEKESLYGTSTHKFTCISTNSGLIEHTFNSKNSYTTHAYLNLTTGRIYPLDDLSYTADVSSFRSVGILLSILILLVLVLGTLYLARSVILAVAAADVAILAIWYFQLFPFTTWSLGIIIPGSFVIMYFLNKQV